MSHTVKINAKFLASELPVLLKVFAKLGWVTQENELIRSYDRTTERFPIVAKNPDKEHRAYDIGLKIEGSEVQLYTDFYGGSVAKTLGPDLQILKQEYAVAVIEDEYPNASIVRNVLPNGDLEVTVEEWA